jgi:hypothetical protein
MALEYGKKNGLHVVTFCPGLVVGPLLQHVAVNTSSKVLLYIIKGKHNLKQNQAIFCGTSHLLPGYYYYFLKLRYNS